MAEKRHGCKARQHCDEMQCHKCGLFWEVKDPEPPKCIVKSKNKKPVIN